MIVKLHPQSLNQKDQIQQASIQIPEESDFHTIKPINHNAPSQSEWCVRLESEFYKLGLIDKVKVKVK